MDELENKTELKRELEPSAKLDNFVLNYANNHQKTSRRLIIFPRIVLKAAAAAVLLFGGYFIANFTEPATNTVTIEQSVIVESPIQPDLLDSIDMLEAELAYYELNLQSELITFNNQL